MPTVAWTGFLHAWHNLGIVLKWMCITVIGIPIAFATCVVVALACVAFAALCLLAVAAAFAAVFYVCKGIFILATRIPYWTNELRIHYAERRLFILPTDEKRTFKIRWPSQSLDKKQQSQPVPPGYMPAKVDMKAIQPLELPEIAHIKIDPEQVEHAMLATELATMRECQICMEERLPWHFPSRKPTEECEHEATDCCNACLTQAITTCFENNMWDDIRCPMCNLKLKHQDVKELAPEDIFHRYDAISLRQTLSTTLPNFRWCINPACSFGQEHPNDPLTTPIVVCSACGFMACSKHNVPWHEGVSCDAFDRRAAGAEKRSEKIIKKVAKRCPGCRRFINKNGGCNHMSCVCGKQFCWNCFHDYPGHTWNCAKR